MKGFASFVPLILLCAATVAVAAPTPGVVKNGVVEHGRFSHAVMTQPAGAPQGFVLLFSGAQGWDAAMKARAAALATHGALVAGIDTPAMLRELNRGDDECIGLQGDFENLSRFIQAYYAVPGYRVPILAGVGEGAAFAYLTLAQADPQRFAGGVLQAFTPHLALTKPPCVEAGAKFRSLPHHRGVEVLPVAHIGHPLVILQAAKGAASVQTFFAHVPGAEVQLTQDGPKGGQGGGPGADQGTSWLAAYDRIESTLVKPVAPPKSLSGLPVVEMAQTTGGPSDLFAVILSGDGGWADLDRDVADVLVQRGIPVVGVDSLRYFWGQRTPEGTAADIDRIVRYYTARWQRSRVLLIGYSQGADVLPFVVNRLSPDVRAEVVLAAGMGLSHHATFQFHMANWIRNDTQGPQTLPEIRRIHGILFLCIYGAKEDDSACPDVAGNPDAKVIKLPGGHHFDSDYAHLADVILGAVPSSAEPKR